MTPDNEAPRIYDVRLSEAAEADLEEIVWQLLGRSPAEAERWEEALAAALSSLEQLPNRCAYASEEALARQGIRQLRFGTGRRQPFRLIFITVEATANERAFVRVLRIAGGAQLIGPHQPAPDGG